MARLVDLCAQHLSLHIDYDAVSLKGAITLRVASSLSDQELWELTNRVLATRGFAMVQLSGAHPASLSVVKLADASGLAISAKDRRIGPRGRRETERRVTPGRRTCRGLDMSSRPH